MQVAGSNAFSGKPGQVWNDTLQDWVWPYPDRTPVGATHLSGPVPTPSADIKVNADQAHFYTARLVEYLENLTGLGIVGGPPLTVNWLIQYTQSNAHEAMNLAVAIRTIIETIRTLAVQP